MPALRCSAWHGLSCSRPCPCLASHADPARDALPSGIHPDSAPSRPFRQHSLAAARRACRPRTARRSSRPSWYAVRPVSALGPVARVSPFFASVALISLALAHPPLPPFLLGQGAQGARATFGARSPGQAAGGQAGAASLGAGVQRSSRHGPKEGPPRRRLRFASRAPPTYH